MARAQFQKGQKVWVECVGAWAFVEKVQPVWAKGFEEPVRVTYDVGLGREFAAHELMVAAEDAAAGDGLDNWRLLRAHNRWQSPEDCLHHPYPGSYPVVVTDVADWGGWRVPGAEYDRTPERIEFQARLIAAAPALLRLAEQLTALVGENPDDAPPAVLHLARQARTTLNAVTQVAAPPPERLSSPAAAA
ncbi:hypothetical protein [Brevundimonas sp. SORGH_AS_0993]|uniref:hypothetical protein n=1 Tax=Brevundimonas sp. SORGH_AS_0993 TaxID=3041794 RepID=UPI0027D83FF5|nr:hypothetical protein [Brevundimonas sp. SORGH_AS_0993]